MPKEAKLTFLYKIDNCDSDVTKVNFKTSHFQQKNSRHCNWICTITIKRWNIWISIWFPLVYFPWSDNSSSSWEVVLELYNLHRDYHWVTLQKQTPVSTYSKYPLPHTFAAGLTFERVHHQNIIDPYQRLRAWFYDLKWQNTTSTPVLDLYNIVKQIAVGHGLNFKWSRHWYYKWYFVLPHFVIRLMIHSWMILLSCHVIACVYNNIIIYKTLCNM